MSVGAVLFDLDGTLVDSLADIGDSMNAVLAELGLPTHAPEVYRVLVGDGARALAQRALPPDAQGRLEDVLARYKAHYDAHPVVKSRPYPGIVSMLDALVARGVPLAVVTNKPHELAVEIVPRLLPSVRFAAVLGQKDGLPHKPDPAGPLSIARELGIDPARALFVGDTDTDMKTAVRAGMVPVGVLWGFRGEAELRAHGARHVVRSPLEIVAIAERLD